MTVGPPIKIAQSNNPGTKLRLSKQTLKDLNPRAEQIKGGAGQYLSYASRCSF